MKAWLKEWLPGLAAIAAGAWRIAASIGAVQTTISDVRVELKGDLHSLELRMEKRLTAVETKLDLLIEANGLKATSSPPPAAAGST